MKGSPMTIKDCNIEAITGYKPRTSFYRYFSIADRFGEAAVKGTYQRAFSEWETNHIYLTELSMVLNWKIWEHYESSPANKKLSQLYNDLWEATDAYCQENLKGEELSYYYRNTD